MEDTTQQIASNILAVELRALEAKATGRDEPTPGGELGDLVTRLVKRLRPDNNSRRFIRMPMSERVRVRLPSGETLELQSEAIGNGGMGVKGAVEQLRPGTRVQVSMIGMPPTKCPENIEAIVRWRRGESAGVEFVTPIADRAKFDGLYRNVWLRYLNQLAVYGRGPTARR